MDKELFSVSVLTLFPEMFPGVLGYALAGKALHRGIWELKVTDIRDFSLDKHKTVDDSPAGGGYGMVLRADVVSGALDSVINDVGRKPILYFSPRGRKIEQSWVREISKSSGVICVCGRYEGLDQRVIDEYNMTEVSLGDFILSGGEIAAQAFLDSCIRLLPGVVSSEGSLEHDSFENGLLEYPLYTKPRVWRGREIPSVLLSGHHKKIDEWRLECSIKITKERRSDLWNKYNLNK